MEQNGSKPYPFDQQEVVVQFIGRPADPKKPQSTPKMVSHKLRRPTLEEIIEWEKSQVAHEQIEVSARENQILFDDGKGDARLWDKIILEVQGYDFGNGDLNWRTLDTDQKAKMALGHKTTAISGLYQATATVREGDSEGVIFDQQEWVIDQEIGSPESPFLVTHTLREPTEPEIRKFNNASSSTVQIKGSRKRHHKVTTHIKTHIDLYNTLILKIETGGKEIGQQVIDPLFKRQVIATLMSALQGQLQD